MKFHPLHVWPTTLALRCAAPQAPHAPNAMNAPHPTLDGGKRCRGMDGDKYFISVAPQEASLLHLHLKDIGGAAQQAG